MELENGKMKQTYIQLLVNTQNRKLEILKQLLQLTEQQESLIVSDDFSEDEFLKLVSMKEQHIEFLTQLDDGFEKLYDNVKEDLLRDKEQYKEEIKALKELIALITDYSVKLQALEKRNKSRIEVYFSNRRKEIKNSRVNNQSVTNYYKTMTKQHETQAFFYDKKN